MTLQMMDDSEIFADPQAWLLDVLGDSGYKEFKNQWPAISSKTKIEITTSKTAAQRRWGRADCTYSPELDTLFITR